MAVEISARWVTRAPLSEQAHPRLMAAQALNGQRPAALLTYHQLQDTLKKELGLQPDRETVLLANNIDQGRFSAERFDSSSTVDRVSFTDRQRHLTLPLVGRSDEHNRLVESFHKIGWEKAQAVVLIGAAGVGKTRLLNAFKKWALLDSPETEVWQGQAFETGGRLAFQPVVEALRIRLDQVNAPEDLLEDVWLAELSQLMPELRARYPDLPMPLTGSANFVRARLFESIATLGNALAAGRPSVLILDDMQWANADTLDLIHYLARRWAEMNAPILLLLTVRQEAYAADAALREWLTRLERDTSLTRLLLDNLSGKVVEELVNHHGGLGLALGYIDQYGAYAESLGHPNEKHGHQLWRVTFYLAVGALDEAERWADKLYSERKTFPPNFITPYFVEVARTKIARGKLDEGRAILDELVATLPLDTAWSYSIIDIAIGYGEFHLALGQPENLFAGLAERMQLYREAGFGRLLADEHWLRGRAALALGQYDEAREALLKAKGEAKAQEERAILWKILVTLSELEQARGDMAAADKFRDQARVVVDYIAAHAGEMRDVFLSQPAVAKLLAEVENL